MSEEEYNNRIGKINAEISTDRVDADRGHYLLLQKLYLKDRYIEGLQQKVEQQEKEIERLNNITNELEKSIKDEYDYCDKRLDPAFGVGMGVTRKLLDKLKELKENK